MNEPKPPFVRRVALRNYKSIRQCDVALGPLTFLVGPNGSGKSNFVDALRFVAESLRGPMNEALGRRKGYESVRCRSAASPEGIRIQIEVSLPGGEECDFSVVIGVGDTGEGRIVEETCRVRSAAGGEASYCVRGGRVESPIMQAPPPLLPDRLYLTNASGYPQFRPLYDHLAGMRFYSVVPEAVRFFATEGRSGPLLPNGSGAAFALREVRGRAPGASQMIDDYMQAVLPGLQEIKLIYTTTEISQGKGRPQEKRLYGDERVFMQFVMRSGDESVAFRQESMSDGTLHALGVLLALFQCMDRPPGQPIALVAIEEPEATLHPGAAAVLFDALDHASHFTQVLVTTHSADLLERKDVDIDSLLVVESVDGASVIAPVDEATRSILRDRLYTAGELLRIDQLQPANPAATHTP